MVTLVETRGNDTIVRFSNIKDFLKFHGAMIFKLGDELYGSIRTQLIEGDSPYAFQFKTEDYDKFIR
jgi:hypothetical protein